MLIRTATIDDLEAVAAVEAECFPPAEAATKEAFEDRLNHYGNHFWLMFDEDRLIAFVDGLVTCEPDLTDEMYEKADMHDESGQWQMIFGVNTIPEYRRHGYAGELIQRAIDDAKVQGRAGLVLTCKDKLVDYYARFGFVNEGNVGTWGIEQQYNSYLNGVDGRVSGYYDADLNLVTNTWEAVPGDTIVSTIDVFVQKAVENRIAAFLSQYRVNNIGVLVMDVSNGEIVAMASNSGYDLNNPRELPPLLDANGEVVERTAEEKIAALNKMWRNFCINDTYEPGSTFKCLTVAAALEEHVVEKNSKYHCGGKIMIEGAKDPIKCNATHGDITLTESLMKSCNMAMIKIADGMGKSIFHYYQTHFGLGSKTGIDLPGEASGILMDETKISTIELATLSFGQGFNVTMTQMAAAYASVVNGGYYYQPHVVRQVVNAEGATVYDASNLLVRKTVSAETSEFLRNATYMTVQSGTAKPAQVEGYLVGGKTGTAQKLPRKDHKYVVSFVGSVPANNPQYVIYVVIDDIDDEKMYNKSTPATSLTSQILGDILPYLHVYPEGDIEYGVPYTGIIEDDEINEGSLPDETDGDATTGGDT